jgi:hypothetical protein
MTTTTTTNNNNNQQQHVANKLNLTQGSAALQPFPTIPKQAQSE